DAICTRSGQVRMVCIAGPSSAGKTTFVRRLTVQMLVNGVKPISLGLDDYYRNRAQIPLGDDGEPDLESLDSLDTDLLSDHITRLVRGEAVAIPRFDFKLGQRVPEEEWQTLQLHSNQVLMIEGLHGLNPMLAPQVDRNAKFLVFINALTQLILDEHNRMPTSKIRFLRRIVRDRRYRGSRASETLSLWPKVRAGECKFIFPFQGRSDALFNSGLLYETAVLRNLAWRYLLEVPRTDPNHCVAYRLLKFLEHFIPVEEKAVPSNSVLREFLGDSSFAY
ncbi:MAG: nucleoside kinase, partial [Candidatus Eremiobacteraeota bacterium]|nr:nucleoside kinase [Candidatus Eremiobacteraeota bacterium]